MLFVLLELLDDALHVGGEGLSVGLTNISSGLSVCRYAISMSHSALRGSSLKHDVSSEHAAAASTKRLIFDIIEYTLNCKDRLFCALYQDF